MQALFICPNASVAALYRLLYRALGFPAIQSHARLPQEARIAALDLFRMQPTGAPVGARQGARTGAGRTSPPPSGGILLFATDLVLMGAELPAVDLVVQVGGVQVGDSSGSLAHTTPNQVGSSPPQSFPAFPPLSSAAPGTLRDWPGVWNWPGPSIFRPTL